MAAGYRPLALFAGGNGSESLGWFCVEREGKAHSDAVSCSPGSLSDRVSHGQVSQRIEKKKNRGTRASENGARVRRNQKLLAKCY